MLLSKVSTYHFVKLCCDNGLSILPSAFKWVQSWVDILVYFRDVVFILSAIILFRSRYRSDFHSRVTSRFGEQANNCCFNEKLFLVSWIDKKTRKLLSPSLGGGVWFCCCVEAL